MAQGVVDGLEAVQVQVADADRVARSTQGRVQALEEHGPVGQPGQRVVQGLVRADRVCRW